MRRVVAIDNVNDCRNVNLGQVRLEAEMRRGEVLVECLRGAGKLVNRLRRRPQRGA